MTIRYKLAGENWKDYPKDGPPTTLGTSSKTRAGLVMRSFPILDQADQVAQSALRLLLLDAVYGDK